MKQGRKQLFAAIAFGAIFSFGLGNGLPSHILGAVGAATFERNGVVDHIPSASPCSFPSYRAGMKLFEIRNCFMRTNDSAARVPSATLTPSTGERRNEKK